MRYAVARDARKLVPIEIRRGCQTTCSLSLSRSLSRPSYIFMIPLDAYYLFARYISKGVVPNFLHRAIVSRVSPTNDRHPRRTDVAENSGQFTTGIASGKVARARVLSARSLPQLKIASRTCVAPRRASGLPGPDLRGFQDVARVTRKMQLYVNIRGTNTPPAKAAIHRRMRCVRVCVCENDARSLA